jgi:hypothetical protein
MPKDKLTHAPLLQLPNFKDVLLHCTDGKGWNKFIVSDGFVFRANKQCIPASSVHLLLKEAHGSGLIGHFGAKKTEGILTGHFLAKDEKRCGEICYAL